MSEAIDLNIPAHHDSIDGIALPAAAVALFGHEDQTRFLMQSWKSGRTHHGLVLSGDKGIGKATTAFHLANWIFSGATSAIDRLPSPDPASATYRQIAQGSHPNLLHISRALGDDGKRFKTVITVDDIRRIHGFLSMSASADVPRIVIIDPADDLNINAGNALLKMLEEPPQNVLFILIAHNQGSLLPTIKSRTQKLSFSPLPDATMRAALAHIYPKLIDDSGALEHLIGSSGGSVRQAIIMHTHGGRDLDEAIDAILERKSFDTAKAYQLAEAASARDGAVHERLIVELLFSKVHQRALEHIQAGHLRAANSLAEYEAEMRERDRVAKGYNLDKKEEILNTLSQAHKRFHMLAA